MTKDQIKGKVFTSGPLAMTDVHNGGSIFGIIFTQYLEFISDNEVNMKNEVTFNRGMQDWQDSKAKEYWKGFYDIDRDDKHIRCELTYKNEKIVLYADLIDDDTLLCEEYFNSENNGQGRVFSRV